MGLGLIGASLGLDLQARGYNVLGVSRNPQTCSQAITKGVCQRSSTDLALLSEAEIIFLATPIESIVPSLERLIPWLSLETVVTDVASVKTTIVTECSNLWTNFVGGHPMAGTAQQGLQAAQYDLFRNAPYVLTPIDKTPQSAITSLKEIIDKLGCLIYFTSPVAHDSAVAWISHLPVMVSAALLKTLASNKELNILDLTKKLASSGLRDTSRVGGGNPELGVMMANQNRSALLKSLRDYGEVLNQMIDLIEKEDYRSLEEILVLTQQIRPQFVRSEYYTV